MPLRNISVRHAHTFIIPQGCTAPGSGSCRHLIGTVAIIVDAIALLCRFRLSLNSVAAYAETIGDAYELSIAFTLSARRTGLSNDEGLIGLVVAIIICAMHNS